MTLSSSQVSLSLSLVSYSQASRWADPALPQLSPCAQLAQVQADTVMVILVLLTLLTLCWQWLWRMFSLSSRMFVFCLFLTLYPNQFFIFLVLHYLGMLVWVLAMRTNFCGSMDDTRRPVSEFVYNIVIAAVLIFDIVNIKDGPTRLRNSVYYTIVTLENTVLMVFWWSAGVSFIGVDKMVIVVVYAALQFLALKYLENARVSRIVGLLKLADKRKPWSIVVTALLILTNLLLFIACWQNNVVSFIRIAT